MCQPPKKRKNGAKKSCRQEAKNEVIENKDDSSDSSGEEETVTTESSKSTDSPQIWKLCKQKYLLVFKLCNNCSEYLFNNKKRFSRKDNMLNLAIALCDDCVRMNVSLTDLLYPKKKDDK